MILQKISIINYKNIRETTLTLSPKMNCLIGFNGAGKTNFLDAVYYPALANDGSKITQKAPLIVGFHGGGFLFGGYALNDAMWIAHTHQCAQ